jgi:hypothetical protein
MKAYIRLFVCLFLFAGAVLPADAQTRSIISNLANPAIGFNALFLGQVAPELNQPYGMQFQESEISIISTVDPDWTLAANIVFAPEGVDPEEVYATTSSIKNLLIKVGKIRGAFGKHGTLHTHAFPFIQAPVIMSNSIGEEGFKDAGIEGAWLTPLPWYCELTLGAYQAVGLDADHPLNLGSQSHDNIPYLGHLKNLFDLDDNTTLEMGASALTGMGDDGFHHAVYGTDLTIRNVPLRQSNQKGWILQAEYLKRVSYNNSVYNQDADGWYASFQYRLDQQWWTGIRGEEAFHSTTDVLSQMSPSSGPLLEGHVQRVSANLSWLPSEFSEIRLEYSAAKINPDNGSGTVWDHRAMLQFNFIIGFHPPHAY